MYDNNINSSGKGESRPKTDEQGRLNALRNYEILYTGQEVEFDRIIELAALLCEVPIAAISLVAEKKQWYKSKIGTSIVEMERDHSFCQFAIKGEGLYEVKDTLESDLYRNLKLSEGSAPIRYYAGYPLIDPEGYALGTICVIDHKPRELTEKQRHAMSILASEVVSQIISRKQLLEKRHFEELFMRSVDLVCMANFEGYFKKVNPAFSAVLGWSTEEMSQKPFIDFVHPDDRQKTFDEMAKLSRGMLTINFSNRYLTKTGEYKVLKWVSTPDIDSGTIYAIAHDMTNFLESQEKIYMAEKKFRDLFENSPDSIFVEDFNGNILDVNAAGVELQGCPLNELIGKNIKDFVPKNKFVKILTDYKKLFLGLYTVLESSVWSRTKGIIPVEITGKKIIYDNKPALLLHVRDITERKKIEADRAKALIERNRRREEQIKRTLRIQEEERNRIAMEIHDEVGTGLSSISILGNVIKKDFNNPSSVSTNIDKIIGYSRNIQENISEIIWAMNPKNDTVENLISFINNYSSEFLGNSSIEFTIELPEVIPHDMINGKIRRSVFLVVKESLNNISKYACASSVRFQINVNQGLFSVSIQDNGKGFNLEDVPRFSNGINNMRQRIAAIHGLFKINSAANEGTNIFLEVRYKSSETSY